MRVNAWDFFLNQKRFDLIFKYLYTVHSDNDYIKSVYVESIRVFNNFNEPIRANKIEKKGKEQFIESFTNLIASMKAGGYDKTKGIIPVGNNGEIQDGAHRLCCAAALKLDVDLEQQAGKSHLFDYIYFKRSGMDPDIMDFGALEYVKLNPNAYIVNLQSIADKSKDNEVLEILNKYGFVFYQKDIEMSFNGYVNLKKISYGSFWLKERWIGSVENHFLGAQRSARESMGDNPLRVFVFVCDDLNKVVQAKSEIRDIHKIGNYSVHINDTHEEAIWLAETYFNKNSLEMVNSRPFSFEDEHFDNMLELLKENALKENVFIEDICLAGSSPLDIYGLRNSHDLDFLCISEDKLQLHTQTLSTHDSELEYYPYSKREIIENPAYHFYWKGFKCITLDILYQMKLKRNEQPKDVNDCKMLEKFNQKKWKPKKRWPPIYRKHRNGSHRTIILFGVIKFSWEKKKKTYLTDKYLSDLDINLLKRPQKMKYVFLIKLYAMLRKKLISKGYIEK